jgi:hypothetical protein
MYKLVGEENDLVFDMLFPMDGNDSLKRVLRRDATGPSTDDGEEPAVGASSERIDSRSAGGDYYLTRAEVDRWAKEAFESILPDEVTFCFKFAITY